MKPIIKASDYNTITSIINKLPLHLRTKEVGNLQHELAIAEVVADKDISSKVIQLNSYFEVEQLNLNKRICFTLTLPAVADITKQKISVLSPFGIALIGFEEGMTVEWNHPAGIKKFYIQKVLTPSFANN